MELVPYMISKLCTCISLIGLCYTRNHRAEFSHFKFILSIKTFFFSPCSNQGLGVEISLPRLIFLGNVLPSLVAIVSHLSGGALHNLLQLLLQAVLDGFHCFWDLLQLGQPLDEDPHEDSTVLLWIQLCVLFDFQQARVSHWKRF